ncbi:MAG: hypothetical protein ACNA7O_04035 [Rhodobacterales bacterium]
MTKYFIGLGILVVAVIGFFLLAPPNDPPAPMPDVAEPAAVPPAAAPAPETAAPADAVTAEVTPATPDEETLLETMAADTREGLPTAVTDTVTLNDALFLPRMRIMEYSYVTTAADARASARDMRNLIEASAETICTEGRQMFEMGVTLRNSFEDRAGNLFQRVYLLPEDCRRFY